MDMEQATGETGPMTELFNLKSGLEENISQLHQEIVSLKERISFIKEEKELARKSQATQFQKHYQLKIELVDAQRELDTFVKSVEEVRQMVKESENSIWDIVALRPFDENINCLRASIEGAINFYSEESLKLELVKRTNTNRERRVELTRLSTEYDNKLKEIEEAKRELERRKKLELEKERQQQEMRERLEQERIQAEKERQRRDFLKNRFVPLEVAPPDSRQTPFRNVSFKLSSPEPESKPSLPGSEGVSSISGAEGGFTSNISKYNGLPPLSQFTRW